MVVGELQLNCGLQGPVVGAEVVVVKMRVALCVEFVGLGLLGVEA